MPMEVQLWAHPECDTELEGLLNAGGPAKGWINRTFAVLDGLVARLRETGAPPEVLTDVRPQPLARVSINPITEPMLPWLEDRTGAELLLTCDRIELALFQVGRLRSTVAVMRCRDEIFVVWLEAHFTPPPRDDGFIDADDAAHADQNLWSLLGRLLDMSWLEDA